MDRRHSEDGWSADLGQNGDDASDFFERYFRMEQPEQRVRYSEGRRQFSSGQQNNYFPFFQKTGYHLVYPGTIN